MRPRGTWMTAAAVAGALLFAATGCSQSPTDSTAGACESEAVLSKLRDDVKTPDTVTAEALSIENRPDSAAYDISGTTTLSFKAGADVVHDWKCFAQIVDGKTYAAIRFWDNAAVPGTSQ